MSTIAPRLAFTLGVLLAINFANFYDRQILSAVQEQIRVKWGLTDQDLGLLGTAFIVLYAVVGLPLGRLADVWRRKWILSIGVGLWSLATLATAFAGDAGSLLAVLLGVGVAEASFWALFALRLGVGVGEASCAPAANSLIGDLVPPEKRARALSLFMLGLPLGLALSFLVSGTVAKYYGWEAAFLVAGAPGLALAVLVLFIDDPARGGGHGGKTGPTLPFLAVVGRVLRRPTMWWIIASGGLHNFNLYALGTFLTSYLIRYHKIDVAQAGLMSALVFGCGALGLFGAGWLGDRAFRRGAGGRLLVAWVSVAAAVPCVLLALAVPAGDVWPCVLWLLAANVLFYAYYGTVYAAIQDIIEPPLRGTAMALYFFAMYCLAVFGPVGTGRLSDYFAAQAAAAEGAAAPSELHRAVGLHDAMYVIPVLAVALAAVLFAASLTVKKDLLSTDDTDEHR